MKSVQLKLIKLVGSELCVTPEEGQLVYNEVVALLEKKKKVDLCFEGISILTTAFLNSAIGQLYGKFSDEVIQANISYSGVDPDNNELITRVQQNSRAYFQNKDIYASAATEMNLNF